MPTRSTKKQPPVLAAPTEADRVFTALEVAELTKLSLSTIRNMFADGRIRTIRLGYRIVVPAEEMRRILTEGC